MHATRAASAAWSLGLALAFAIPAAPASAGPADRHPYFDDAGTLSWTTDTQEAMRRARAEGKVVFIEYGRRECTNCRALVQRMLPTALCKSRMSAAAIGLAADCDEPDPTIEALFARALPRATLLPFVAFTTPDLQWISGWAGSIDPQGILSHLAQAESWLERSRAAAAAASPCAAKVGAAAAAAPAPAAPPAPPCAAPTAPITNGEIEAARGLLGKAQAASAEGHPGQVLSYDAEAARLRVRADPEGWAVIVKAANAWADGRLDKACEEGAAGRCDEARVIVDEVRKEMGAVAQGKEAERGQRALAICKAVQALGADNRESARVAAAKEFEGTRWAKLFKA